MTRRPSLARLFADLDARYFDGKLADAEWEAVYTGRCPSQRGRTIVAGECVEDEQRIYVLRGRLTPRRLRRILLHEMAHARTSENAVANDPASDAWQHGAGWRAEMRRIASMGEPWAARQAARYEQEQTAAKAVALAKALGAAPLFAAHPELLRRIDTD